jgi:transcriptional regulator with GAF, ATPase, and Fis domain
MLGNNGDKLYTLIDLAALLGKQNDFHEILRLIIQKAALLIPSDVALIMMLNPQTRQTIKTIYAEGKEIQNRKCHFVHTNISGWVIQNNRSFLTQDIQSDSRFQKNLFKNIGVKSAICIPFRIEASLVGTLLMLNKTGSQPFSENDLDILEKLADIASPFLRNVQKIQQFFITALPKQTLLKKYKAFGLFGKSKKFIELLQAIEAAARSIVRILLEGESGTGKELVARAIHQTSTRSQNKFIALDCGTIPANLIESELFGHVKGAYTGAATAHKGLLEEAHGGTLFMDEITNLPLEMQSKFLRFLQEGEIRPLGSNQPRQVDVRIISASSVPLSELVEKQQFREDLFYRLNVYPISVPSLNERREDIPLLTNHFIKKFSQQQNKQVESFHGTMLDFMKQRSWKGNIRELENFIERLVTLAPTDMNVLETTILPKEFQKEFRKIKKMEQINHIDRSLRESLEEYEEKLIRTALIECDWNQSKAARLLKISEPAIRSKMKKLGIIKKG